MKESVLRKIIRKEIREARFIDKEDIGREMLDAVLGLEEALKNARNPESWAEKYHRSAVGVIDIIERLTRTFAKMK